MRYLAIDYGLSHVGLAISEGYLAEPYSQLNYFNDAKLIEDIAQICRKENIDVIVVGVSEGQIAIKTKQFAQSLEQQLSLTVHLQDETLSSQEANQALIQAGSGPKKRQEKGHQTAAALILQNFLDRN